MITFDNSTQLGEWYDKKYTEMGGGWKVGKEEALRLIKWAGFQSNINSQLLDIGCGDGDFISHIDDKFTCIGIELSEVAWKLCKARRLNAYFYHQDIETISPHIFRDGRFDYITSIGSIEHCLDIDLALRNCHRILRDSGKFLVLVPNELWPHQDQPQEQTHTDKEWPKIFGQAGFIVAKVNRRNDLTDFLLVKKL